jgi:RHS repeat-associated protein
MKHIVDVTGTPVTANYVWDVNRNVPEILQDGTNTYVYGLGLISSTDGSGVQTYYDSDGLGSTSDLTNSSAAKTDGYTYDAFGTPTHSPSSSTQPFQFTGQQTDADSGLQYLRARYYDPSTGRFLSRDPRPGSMRAPQTQDRYVYALGNPATLVDPLGLCSPWDPGDCIDDLVPVVLNGVQVADLLPIPGPVGSVLDVAAAIASQIQIVTNTCISNGEKIGLTLTNGLNLGVGLVGNYTAELGGWVTAFEVGAFVGSQADMSRCSIASLAITNAAAANSSSPHPTHGRKE